MRKDLTGERAVLQIEAQAAAYGVRPTHDSNGRRRYLIACGECQHEDSVFNSKLQHVEDILSHFRKKGWVFARGAHPYCSTEHDRDARRRAKREKERLEEQLKHPISHPVRRPVTREEAIAMTTPSTAALSAALPTVPSTAIGPNPQIIIQVITLLNEHFDKAKRLYNAGWSDERIAKEADTALTLVVSYREAGYGKLAEDPEKTRLKGIADALEAKIMALSNELDAFKVQIDRFTGVHHKAQG